MIGAIEIFEIAHDDLEMSGMIVIYVSFMKHKRQWQPTFLE